MPITFPPVDLPRCPPADVGPGRIRADIDRWIRSDAVTALVTAFGGKPLAVDADEAMAHLISFSEVWDYRRGLERDAIRSLMYADKVHVVVDGAVTALGLGERTLPPHDSYDDVLVLGGGPRTAIARPDHAARLLRGPVRATRVAALSSLRSMGKTELEFASDHDMPGATVEADAMAAGMARAFGPPRGAVRREGVTAAGSEWWTLEYRSGEREISIVAAPSSEPEIRRANTPDTFVGWADLIGAPRPTDRVLVVTTDLFVPFQHADAVRCLGLPYGCGIETVGLNAATYPNQLRPNTRSALLQEVRSAILSLSRLADACAAWAGSATI